MIIILSPSKTLAKIDVKAYPKPSQPAFLDQSQKLVDRLRDLSAEELRDFMGISANLARLNFERYLQWQTPFDEKNSTPALLAFKGVVYEGISSVDFSFDDFKYAQNHVLILSGLYGALRPLDLMQPYRLEMGSKIDVGSSKNLYVFWQETLTDHINQLLANDKEITLVNLASNEYFKAIIQKGVKGKIVTPVFKEQKGNAYKTVAIHAKRARGVMTRFVVKNRIEEVEHLKAFAEEGYVFSPEQTKADQWVFVR